MSTFAHPSAGSSVSEHMPGKETVGSTSIAFQQRLVASYDSSTNAFSEYTFFRERVDTPTRDKALNLLLDLQRGRADYRDFLDKLPVASVLPEDRQVATEEVSLGDDARVAVNNLLDHGSDAPVNDRTWEKIIETYGTNGGDVAKLADDLYRKNPKLDPVAAGEVLKAVHGELRRDVYEGISQLQEVVRADPQKWEGVLEKLTDATEKLPKREQLLLQAGRDEILRVSLVKDLNEDTRTGKFLEKKGLKRSNRKSNIWHDKKGRTYDLDKRQDARRLWRDHTKHLGGDTTAEEFDWKGKDFYKVLGVATDASDGEIRQAYERLERRFREASEAWRVLGDGGRKARYDRMRMVGAYHRQARSGGYSGTGGPVASALHEVMQRFGVPRDYVFLRNTGCWMNTRSREVINPRTEAGARRLLDELRREQPWLQTHPGLSDDLARLYGASTRPSATSPPPQPSPPPEPLSEDRIVWGEPGTSSSQPPDGQQSYDGIVWGESGTSHDTEEVNWLELRFRAQTSMGLRQRIVASYNPETGDFDMNTLLADPSQRIFPDYYRALAYLNHVKAGAIHPEKLINKLPGKLRAMFDSWLYMTDRNGRLVNKEAAGAVCKLVGVESLRQITGAQLDAFHAKYGPRNGSIVQLASDLQRIGVKEKVILRLLYSLHSEFRTSVLFGFVGLNETALSDPTRWEKRAKSFTRRAYPLNGVEKHAIVNDRRVLGMQQVQRAVRQQVKGQAERIPRAARQEARGIESATFGQTDAGRVRDHNEDTFWNSQDNNMFVVADGMGGHQAGEVASAMAVQTISESYGPGFNIDTLRYAIEEANRRIYHNAVGNSQHYGMGTTVVAGVLEGNSLSIANVGDSRAYLFRAGAPIERLTVDHTWAEEQRAAGVLTDEEARTHPQRNVVTRSLGNRLEVAVDIKTVSVQKGDVILLCSDGLHDLVTDQEIYQTVLTQNPQQACKSLIDLANSRGGPDNITVVVKKI